MLTMSLQALEKFSGSASEIAINLRQLCNRIQDTQFPNDVKQTELLIDEHDRALTEVRRHLDTVIQHGETLLMCFKTIRTSSVVQLQHPSTTSSLTDQEKNCAATYQDTIVTTSQLPLSRVGHVTAVERSVESFPASSLPAGHGYLILRFAFVCQNNATASLILQCSLLLRSIILLSSACNMCLLTKQSLKTRG
jgi:hypothetical protein